MEAILSKQRASTKDVWPVSAPTAVCDICKFGASSGFELISSLNKQCPGCNFLLTIIAPYTHLLGYEPRVRVEDRMGKHFGPKYVNLLSLMSRSSQLAWEYRLLELYRSPESISEHIQAFPWKPDPVFLVSEISGNTGSDEAVQWAAVQVALCCSGHQKCLDSVPTPLPARVLEILGYRQVRLAVPPSQTIARYVCLSHCWGSQNFLTTTRANLEHHQHSIPWNELPKTFQEALDFTHRLNLRYLWIDALCIIQDDLEDWRDQGSRMANIYQHSFLTLSVMKSSDSSQGCYAQALPEHTSQKLTFPDPDGQEHILCIRSPPAHYIRGAKGDIPQPLATRGWVLQEMLLSRRILHFMPHELVWECNEYTACECSDSMLDLSYYEEILPTGIRSSREEKSVQTWYAIVAEYTKRALTYERDIFPALQGIAKHFQQNGNTGDLPGAYLAGLWEGTLAICLLWRKLSHQSHRRGSIYCDTTLERPKDWRAPTWSWASCQGAVEYGLKTSEESFFKKYPIPGGEFHTPENLEQCATINATAIPLGNDAFGELKSGRLDIKGSYLDVILSCEDQGRDGIEFSAKIKSSGLEVGGDHFLCWPDIKFWSDGPAGVLPEDTVRMVILMKEYWTSCGLVLRKQGGDNVPFERIGMFVSGDYYERNWLEGETTVV